VCVCVFVPHIDAGVVSKVFKRVTKWTVTEVVTQACQRHVLHISTGQAQLWLLLAQLAHQMLGKMVRAQRVLKSRVDSA
jgi:hypothetical protein